MPIEEIRKRLREIVIEKSLSFGKFVLASGKESSFYLDCRKATLHPEGLYCISRLFLEKIKNCGERVDAIGGPMIGADPLVAGVVLQSHVENNPVEGFIVRKEQKDHGAMRKIEGNLKERCNVVIVDDVVTTGGSIITSIEEVESLGCKVVLILSVVDRGEGGRELFQGKKYNYQPIFTIDEILRDVTTPAGVKRELTERKR